MIRYRIYTENKNLDCITQYLSNNLNNYTLIKGVGVWLGQQEGSIIIEVISNADIYGKINAIATQIKVYNKQEAVLITKEPIDAKLI